MVIGRNIRRIVFHDVKKYDGEDCRPLTSAHAKQIAGRAGRYGLNHSSGLVTT
ncbi:MAG: hypothetical protein MJE68_31715 [Proteobacteria bacterium]|nr:hypothetical protein [Pseudomonadota bacterium]